MAVQSYVKRSNAYSASTIISGADPDGGIVYVSLTHEWGDPIFNHSRLTSYVAPLTTLVQVIDGTQFHAGDKLIFVDGKPETVTVVSVSINNVTTSATIYAHNSGAQISVEKLATRDSANNYHYNFTDIDLSSSGQHKLRWSYFQSGIEARTDTYLNVYQPYIDSGTFFDMYPELEANFDDFFDARERVVRNIIDACCGQSFDYFPQKTRLFEGSGRNTLYLLTRLERFNTVRLNDDYSDITEIVEFDHNSHFYLRLSDSFAAPIPQQKIVSSSKPSWGSRSDFEVLGDWGWDHTPVNITQAAALLLADQFNEDTQYLKHGIVDISMDTHRMRFDSTMLGTTGNLDADVLLLDYTLFTLGEI